MSVYSCSNINVTLMITSQPPSLLAQNIKIVNSSYIMSAMPSLSKFCGQALSILVENRPSYGWIAIAKMMRKLENLTNQVESHWSRSLLASLSEKTSIGTYSCFCAHASQHKLINCYVATNSRETMTTLSRQRVKVLVDQIRAVDRNSASNRSASR